MNEVWHVFLCAVQRRIAHTAEVHDKHGKRLPRFEIGRSQLEQTMQHLQRLQTSPARRQQSSQRKSPAARVHAHIHRLIALTQDPDSRAPQRRLYADVQLIARVLCYSEAQVRQDIASPDYAIPRWQQRLRRYIRKEQERGVRTWKRTLTHKNQVTPRLFRWLRGGLITPGMSVTDQDGTATGARQVFASLRRYWRTIMQDCNDSEQQLERLARVDLPYVGDHVLPASLLPEPGGPDESSIGGGARRVGPDRPALC